MEKRCTGLILRTHRQCMGTAPSVTERNCSKFTAYLTYSMLTAGEGNGWQCLLLVTVIWQVEVRVVHKATSNASHFAQRRGSQLGSLAKHHYRFIGLILCLGKITIKYLFLWNLSLSKRFVVHTLLQLHFPRDDLNFRKPRGAIYFICCCIPLT